MRKNSQPSNFHHQAWGLQQFTGTVPEPANLCLSLFSQLEIRSESLVSCFSHLRTISFDFQGVVLLTPAFNPGETMENTTMDPIAGDVINDHDVDRASSCPPTIDSSMAIENMAGDNSAEDQSPESYTLNDKAFEIFIPGNHVPVDNTPAHLAPDHEAPGHEASGRQSPEAYNVHYHRIGKVTPELYIALGDVHDQGKPDTYMGVDDVDGQPTAGDSLLRPITIPGRPSRSKPLK